MDPVLRLRYLQAMGIPQFVARRPLPGARPSPRLDVQAAASEEQPVPLVPAQPAPPPRAAVLETRAAPTRQATARVETSPAQAPGSGLEAVPFHCRAAIWHNEDLLILADMIQLDQAILSLLNDIMWAIGRKPVHSPSAFEWPMQGLDDPSIHAAQDYLHAFLEAGILARSPVRQILAFGAQASTLMTTESQIRFRDWPLLCLPGLQNLLQDPAEKPVLWKHLSILAAAR